MLIRTLGVVLGVLFRQFFGSLYKCLARGARAVLQIYPENAPQLEMISAAALRSGFSGGLVVDYPHRWAVVPFLLITLYCLLHVLSIVGYIVSFGLVDSVPWHALVEFMLF